MFDIWEKHDKEANKVLLFFLNKAQKHIEIMGFKTLN